MWWKAFGNHGDPMRPVFEVMPTTDWVTDLESEFPGLLDASDINQLRPLLGSKPRTLIVESEYIDKDYRNVYSHFYSKKFSRSSSRTTRIHFFDAAFSADALIGASGDDSFLQTLADIAEKQGVMSAEETGTTDGYLGFVVVRPTSRLRLGRTLLDPSKVVDLPDDQHGEVTSAIYSAHIRGERLRIRAFPHQSQDAEAHTCAQTAVWGLFRYLSQRYRRYSETYPFDVVLLNQDLSRGRRFPGRGLAMDQIASMFGEFGLEAELYDVEDFEGTLSLGEANPVWPYIGYTDVQDEFLRLMHIYIDSGLPPIIGVPKHAVVGVGVVYGEQVVNRASPVIPSTDFVQSLIVNDDNYAPYRLIQRGSRAGGSSNAYGTDDVDSLVVPFPEKVFLRADVVEALGASILEDLIDDTPSLRDEPLVHRVYLTSSMNYKAARRKDTDAFSASIVGLPLSHFLWISEFYRVDDWPSGGVSVEIAFDATAGELDPYPFLWIRYPRNIILNTERLFAGEEGTRQFRSSDVPLTFPAYPSNLEVL